METNFVKSAQKFARNPLGIIALFIVLVYGIAGLVMSTSSSNLDKTERLLFIIFLVSFPVIVLIVFAWFVTKHHTKLYAPEDYPDKEGFFRALTPDEQKKRLDKEVKDVQKEIIVTKDVTPNKTIKDRYDLRSKVALVEELAIRDIEDKYGTDVKRQVATWGGTQLDGTFINPKDKRQYVVEVKYTQKSDIKNIVEHAQHIPGLVHNSGLGHWTPLILYIVTENIEHNKIKESFKQVEKIVKGAPYPMTIHWMDYNELKMKYGFQETEE